MDCNILKKYAELIIRVGVNLQKGDNLVISTTKEGLELTKEIALVAYANGAVNIEFVFESEELAHIRYTHENEQSLTSLPAWQVLQKNGMVDRKACYIAILSEDPEIFSDVDANLLSNIAKARHIAFKKYFDAATSNAIRWCLCAVPCTAWATKMFPNCTPQSAEEKLWQYIIKTMRLDQPDSILAWQSHIDRLQKLCDFMNEQKFCTLQYKNSLGTDFSIGLPQGYFFSGGNEVSRSGIRFTANMPTEEIFTLPNKFTAQGKVVASMPLIHNGAIIDKFWLQFDKGRIVDFNAEVGYDTLKGIIESDEGSHYLGEVALVQFDSPIQNLNSIFYNTLFDENASCHLAIGEAYPMIENIEQMSDEQKQSLGVNNSCKHVDFMIGTADLSIIAVQHDGKKVAIFENGNFVI